MSENGEGQGAKNTRCEQAGCANRGEAWFEGQLWCRRHFLTTAARRLDECRSKLPNLAADAAEVGRTTKFLTELIAQCTALAASAQFLSPAEREQLLELSLTAADCYKKLKEGRSAAATPK